MSRLVGTNGVPGEPVRVVVTFDRETVPGSGNYAFGWRSMDVTTDRVTSWSDTQVGRSLGTLVLPSGRYRVRARIPDAAPALAGVPAELSVGSNLKVSATWDSCRRAERGA